MNIIIGTILDAILDLIMKLYKIAGSLICHQLPSRTLHINGLPLPLCARDTGIYTGFFISLVYIYIHKRNRANSPPDTKITIFLCFLMFLMIIDGGSSYIGIRQTSNTLRYYSGAFFGFALPFFLIPAANFDPGVKNVNKSIYSIVEVLILILVNIVIGYVILGTNILPWFLIATITIGILIYVIARIVFTIIIRSMLRKKSYVGILVAGCTIGILLIMFWVSNFILQPVKSLLLEGIWR